MVENAPKREKPTAPTMRPQRRGRPSRFFELDDAAIEAMPQRNPEDIFRRVQAYEFGEKTLRAALSLASKIEEAISPTPSAYDTLRTVAQRKRELWKKIGVHLALHAEDLNPAQISRLFKGVADALELAPAQRKSLGNRSQYRCSVVCRAYGNV